jgi:hypothetical protein
LKFFKGLGHETGIGEKWYGYGLIGVDKERVRMIIRIVELSFNLIRT